MPIDDTFPTVPLTTLTQADSQSGSPSNDGGESPLADIAAHLLGDANTAELLPPDNRITGDTQTLKLLTWLHRANWLTSRMVAALVFPTASQSWPLARRLLKKLLADKLVLVRALPQGGDAYLLSAKGARLLNETTGLPAKSGQGVPTGDAMHRGCGMWYLIAQVQAGLEVFTEREIAAGLAPFQTINGKLVDGAVLHDGGLLTVVEVENTFKNRERRQAICSLAARHLGREKMTEVAPGLYLARLAVVCTNVDALRSIAGTFQEAHRMQTAPEGALAAVDVAVLPISPSLVPGELVCGNLWWDVMQPHLHG